MYTTIRDVMQDYWAHASAAGVSDDEMLSEDQVRDVCHEIGGLYEDLDPEATQAALWDCQQNQLPV